MSAAMKRSILFWPVVSAAGVFLLWLVLSFLLIGVPKKGGPPDFSFPAQDLVGAGRVYSYYESAVTAIWRIGPYCRPSRMLAEWDECAPPRRVQLLQLSEGGSVGFGQWFPLDDFNQGVNVLWVLGPVGVLAYVVLIPGAHFALVAFVLVGVITVLARLLIRAAPEGVAPPPRGEEEGAQP